MNNRAGIIIVLFVFSFFSFLTCEKVEIKEPESKTNKLFSDLKVALVCSRESKISYKLENSDNHDLQSLGICYNTSGKPTRDDNTISLTIDSSGTRIIDGLAPDTEYYFRLYADISAKTVYIDDEHFKTDPLKTPNLTTGEIKYLHANLARSGGNIECKGGYSITARGVCWSKSPNPTVNDSHTTDGTGMGSFTSELNGLTGGTKYYVRAYATNELGTAYGSERTFVAENPFIETVLVEGGTFEMGCTNEQNNCIGDETPVHTVNLKGFRVSKYEITTQQYADFMNEIGANSDGSYDGTEYLDVDESFRINYSDGQFVLENGEENYPVMEVTWYGAKAFCEHYGGRLPTEAEWEYAARGGSSGTPTLYAGSNSIDEVAWYRDNSGVSTHAVGMKSPNELGIYDMSGNVWEWCHDWYGYNYYSNSSQDNPQGPISGSYRILRGGSASDNPESLRVASRNREAPNFSLDPGFRFCLDQ